MGGLGYPEVGSRTGFFSLTVKGKLCIQIWTHHWPAVGSEAAGTLGGERDSAARREETG